MKASRSAALRCRAPGFCGKLSMSPAHDCSDPSAKGEDLMQTRRDALKGLMSAAVLIAAGSPARAADIRVLFPAGLKAVTDVLIPQFEKSTGHKVGLSYANIGTITDRVRKREAA